MRKPHSYREPKNFTHVAVAIVKNPKGEILITKRRIQELDLGGHNVNWTFPGGKLLDHETEHETAVRETLEETGHVVRPLDVISRRVYPNSTTYIHYVTCDLTSDEVKDISDREVIEEVKWAHPKDLLSHFTTSLDRLVAVYLGIL